jgi:chromosome segregation protein
LPDPAQVERNLERLKIERERLGAVNLRAEEEQTELSERLKLIITEREDIIDAIKKLRAGIQSLNKEGRERLLVAFDRSTRSSSGCSPTCLAAVRRSCN